MKKQTFFWLVAMILLTDAASAAEQQANKIPRIGILQSGASLTSPENVNALRKGLRELGYIEGRTFSSNVDTQMASPNVFPSLLRSL